MRSIRTTPRLAPIPTRRERVGCGIEASDSATINAVVATASLSGRPA